MTTLIPLDRFHNIVPIELAESIMVLDDPDHPAPFNQIVERGYKPPAGVHVVTPEEYQAELDKENRDERII